MYVEHRDKKMTREEEEGGGKKNRNPKEKTMKTDEKMHSWEVFKYYLHKIE